MRKEGPGRFGMGFQGWSEALVLQEQVGWNGSKQCRRLGGATMGIHLKFYYWSATQKKWHMVDVDVGLRSRVAAPNLRLVIAGVLLLGYAPASLHLTYDRQLPGCFCWVTLLRRCTQPTIGNCWGVIVGLRSRVAAPNLRLAIAGVLLLGYAPASLHPTYDW